MLFCLALGYVFRKGRLFPENSATILNQFVIYVSLPALILWKIPMLEVSSELFLPVLLPWLLIGVVSGVLWVSARKLKWSPAVFGCLLLLVSLGNTSFFGYPMVLAYFGEPGLPIAILYDQLGSFIALVTFGSFVLCRFDVNAPNFNWKTLLKRMMSFPPFLAAIVGVTVGKLGYPKPILEGLQAMAQTLIPLVMIAIGLQLSFSVSPRLRGPLVIGLGLKLILVPFGALTIFKALGWSGLVMEVSLFEAGMPPMVTAGALAIQADLEPELAAGLVGFGLLISCITLPILFRLF